MNTDSKRAFEAARERDGNRCQFPTTRTKVLPWLKCGSPAVEVHHRRLRSQQGKDEINNLICLCNQHHVYVHRHVAESRKLGLLIHTGDRDERLPWMDVFFGDDSFGDDIEGVFSSQEPGEFPW
jgi:hypothetical protein